ncbi:hypothetical protein CKO18_10790 [Rhodoferax fermentans]|uniref:Uncharacterized protein n=1 Tax=Rhodoferax fermentans TaxID=28066 RepID=A0A1T1AUD1_RHOFE|nr:hypothetical protein [Rhodoferax fermentans]OOV07710.1 hypothetical protein RF819_14145 [Rhodoferax fermentans]
MLALQKLSTGADLTDSGAAVPRCQAVKSLALWHQCRVLMGWRWPPDHARHCAVCRGGATVQACSRSGRAVAVLRLVRSLRGISVGCSRAVAGHQITPGAALPVEVLPQRRAVKMRALVPRCRWHQC